MGADRVTHRDLAWATDAGGIRVAGTEIFETRREMTFAAGFPEDRSSVILVVCGAQYAMPAAAARALSADLVAAAGAVDPAGEGARSPLPAGHQRLTDLAVAGIRDAAAVQQEGR